MDNLLLRSNSLIDAVVAVTDSALPQASAIALQLNVPISSASIKANQLLVDTHGLSLSIPYMGKAITIDFSAGKYDHRRKFGGGRGQPLAKAIGLKKGLSPRVIDATAGFARDAFVIASLGCEVRMVEQNFLLCLLIEDAINKHVDDDELAVILNRMRIKNHNAIDYLKTLTEPAEVIYMDPMYPGRDKSALVKKEMQLLHQLIGPDTDSEELLAVAREIALKRVVVKRPKGADFVGDKKPNVSIESKNTRYDVYVTTLD